MDTKCKYGCDVCTELCPENPAYNIDEDSSCDGCEMMCYIASFTIIAILIILFCHQ